MADEILKFHGETSRAIQDVIESDAGRAGCQSAAAEGKPALAGVEGMLREAFGSLYRKENQATVVAAQHVAGLMRRLGYVADGSKRMPPGSVATQALLWLAPTRSMR